jgi:pimeloyl-ACP methyl ester carboxylesterase
LFSGNPDSVAVLLPGAGYVPAAPLLWFAREAAQAHGWSVLQVWDEFDRIQDPEEWVADRLEAALAFVGEAGDRLVIAKALSSLALPATAAAAIPGVWFTPLLDREDVRAALEAVQAPTLVVGATADPTWDADFVANLENVEVVEIDGSNHVLAHATDPTRSIDYLRTVTQGVGSFIDRLSRRP